MSSSLVTFWEEHWRHIITVVLAIAIAFPLIFPIGLPIHISEKTKDTYKYVNNLPEGSIVLLSLNYAANNWPECGPLTMSLLSHLVQLPVKIAVISWNAEDVGLFTERIEQNIEWDNKVYGEDWVRLGFVIGFETGMKAFADDVWSTTPIDYAGTKVENLEIMADLKTGADIDLIIHVEALFLDPVIRQFNAPYSTPVIVLTQAGNVVAMAPYLASDQAIGMVAGLQGSAEYDSLIGRVSQTRIAMDSLSLSQLFAIILLVFVNVEDLLKRSGK